MDMYQQNIIDHYKNPENAGKLDVATFTKHLANTSCGDEITVYMKVKSDIIENIKFEGIGCAISIASADILYSYLKGRDISEIKKIDLEYIKKLIGIEVSPGRSKCALLGKDALSKDKVEPKVKTTILSMQW